MSGADRSSPWRRWGRGALASLTALFVVLSFLPLWGTDRWWVRQWDYPRLQVAAVLVILLLLLLWAVFRRTWPFWTLVGGAVAALVWRGLIQRYIETEAKSLDQWVQQKLAR